MKTLLTLMSLAALSTSIAAEVDLSLLKNSLNPTAEIKSTKESVIPGLYEVQINNEIVYVSADGEKVISGDIYDLKKQISYTSNAKNSLRKSALATIKDEDKIIYKAQNEKHKVTVFTDISCPYCTKIHQHIQAFNDAGITIEYLAFPRAGAGSEAQKNMQKIWCAEDKNLALTEAKNKQKIPSKTCDGGQTVEQFLLGQDIGVNATPTIVFSDGEIRPGYATPDELSSYLEKKPKL